MARLTVITGDIHSVRASAVELARRLAVDCHDVDVIAPSGVPDELRGFGVPITEHQPPTVPSPAGGLGVGGVRARRGRAVDLLVDHDLDAALDDRDPELVLVDVELSATIVNVLATGRRVALFTTFAGVHRDLSVPPAHTALVPRPQGTATQLEIQRAWARFLVGREAGWARTWVGGRGDSARSRLRRLARRLGLPRGTLGRFEWIRPLGFPALPVIEFNLAEFDLPRPVRAGRHLVGSMVSTPVSRGETPLEDGATDDVTPLVARVEEARDGGRRIVYASFGSFASSYRTDLLQTVVDAVVTERSWQLVLGLGGLDRPPDGVKIPDDVIVFEWAPQKRILELADLAVIHGGHATVYECIEYGVPMVVLPMTLDQPGYAARVEYHGAGLAGDGHPGSDETAATLRARIARVLDDPSFADAARCLSDAAHRARTERFLESSVRSLIEARS